MMTKDQIKERYNAIHEHFGFRDLLGLSALIFGLVLSNSSFEPTKAEAIDESKKTIQKKKKVTEVEKAQPLKKKRKVLKVAKKKRQPITAAHK